MKAQQILNSFLPGVTAAVLTTQPTWAETVTVDNSHSGVDNSVFAISTSNKDVVLDTVSKSKPTVDKDNSISSTSVGANFSKLNPVKPSNRRSVVTVTGKTGALVKALRRNQQSAKAISLKQALKDSTQTNIITPTVIKKDADDKVLTKLQLIAKGARAADLLKGKNCSTQQDRQNNSKLQTLSVSATSACRQINSIPNNKIKIAQPLSPAPVQPTRPNLQGPAPIPETLDPSANPLQFPTNPAEVRVDQIQPLTLNQALAFARRNNQELQVALLQLERAQAQVKEAQAALLPNVGLTTQLGRQRTAGNQLSTNAQERQQELLPPEQRREFDDSPTTAFTGAAQISYDIFTSGARNARIRQAEERERLQELDVERLSEEIRLNVATEYYNLQQADEQVRISQAAVVNAEASLRDAQALEQAGVGTRFDSLRAQVNLANSQQQLTNARSQQRITRRQLATRLNLAQSATLTAADPVQLSGLWNPTLEESIVLAYQNRPELQQQLAQRNISQQQRREALSQLGPQVSVVASYDLLDQFNDSLAATSGYSLAVQANLNLFDGGASRARAAQAEVDSQIAETQFSQQRNQIRFQVEQAYSEQQSNLENVQTSEAALNQARESLRLARLRFQAGVGTQLEVIDAENALTRAEGNRVTAILDYNRALANLQRSVTSRGLR